eukprot:4716757-Alexandrium_andersonii.AAC.1
MACWVRGRAIRVGWCLLDGGSTSSRCCSARRPPPRCFVARWRYGLGARPWGVRGSARPLVLARR